MGQGRPDFDDEESADWGLSRPEHAPPHDRFFEDGEEPPERYDLADAADYIKPNPEPIDSSRWRRLGCRVRWPIRGFQFSLSYYSLSAVSLFLGCLWLFAIVSPAAHGELTLFSMARLTDNRVRFGARRAWPYTLRIALANGPTMLSQIVTVIGVIALGCAVAPTVSYFNAEICCEGGAGRYHPLPEDWPLAPFYILAAFALTWAHAFVCVRIGGFATHLILDYELGGIQALRANWRITRVRTWQLMRLKWRLWFWKTLMISSLYGSWLIVLYEPYASAGVYDIVCNQAAQW